MTDSGGAPVRSAYQAIGTLLRLLAHNLSGLVLLGQVANGRLVIEEAYPDCGLAGERLKLGAGMATEMPVVFSVGAGRIPLDWTRICGGRPSHIVSAPVADGDMYLFVISTALEPPVLEEVAPVAEAIGTLLGIGGSTTLSRSNSRRLAALIDNLPLPLVFVDSKSIDVALNDAARQLLRLGRREMRSHIIAAGLAGMIASADRSSAVHLQHDPQASAQFEVKHLRNVYEVETRWIDQDGLSGRVWMFRDVTEEREARRLKDQLVSNVSHELRTPLTSISGALALLRNSPGAELNKSQTGLIDVAFRNAERLGRLVNDLLDSEKISAKKLKLSLVTTDIAALLVEVMALHEPYASPRAIALDLEIPSRSVVAMVDPDRFVQVIGNLISNAVKFSPEGSLVQVVLSDQGQRYRVSVIDQGSGISSEFRDALFTRFSQENTTKVGQPGTGLGLAISKSIVEAHGGQMALGANVGVGATFHVDLPYEPEMPR